MRILMSGLIAAGLLAAQGAAAEHCAQPRDKAAFDTTALKSELMVTALACDAHERYNAFVLRYRHDLVAEEHVLTQYFSRSFGHRGTEAHDQYITTLANTQSEESNRFASDFCGSRVALFDQVMALRASSELPAFAAGQELHQPVSLITCASHERRTRTASLASSHGAHE